MTSEVKTKPTEVSVVDFIAAVEPAHRRDDAQALVEMLAGMTGEPPVLWGPSIVGFGRYRYRYDSGHEGEAARIGFSPRKAHLVLYIVPGFHERPDLMARLGGVKHSVSCLYINRLSEVDMPALRDLCQWSLDWMKARYPVGE
jgi:hypothetical protein